MVKVFMCFFLAKISHSFKNNVESNQSWILSLTFSLPTAPNTLSCSLAVWNIDLHDISFGRVQMKSHKSKLRRKGEKEMCKNNRKTCRYECFISVRNFIVLSARNEMKKSKEYSKYLHAIKEPSQKTRIENG